MRSEILRNEVEKLANTLGGAEDIKVVWEGDSELPPRTDGKTVYLPAIPEGEEVSDELTTLYRGFIDHEAGGHVRSTDFKCWKETLKSLEGNPTFNIVKSLTNLLEDARIEKKLTDDLPGTKRNLTATAEMATEGIDQAIGYVDFNKKSPESLMAALGEEVRRKPYSLPTTKVWDKHLNEDIKTFAKSVGGRLSKCDSTSDVFDLANKIIEDWEELDLEEERKLEEYTDEPLDAPLEEEKGQEEEDGESGEGGESEEEEDSEVKPRVAIYRDIKDMLSEKAQEDIKIIYEQPKKAGYQPPMVPTTAKDTHKRPNKTNQENYERMKSGISGELNTMKSKLRMTLLSKQNRGWEFGKEVGLLDRKRYSQAIQRMPSVYKQREEIPEIDTAVYILVDCSGSMGGDKIKEAANISIAISECLEGTGIPYAIEGHTAHDYLGKSADANGPWSRLEALHIYKFKGFDEPLRTAKKYIGAIPEARLANNADACAMNHAYRLLLKRQESRKILYVISDGMPEVYSGCKFRTDNWRIHMLDSQEYYRRNHDIETIGVGICAPHVNRYYEKSVNVNNVSEFCTKGFRTFTGLLK